MSSDCQATPSTSRVWESPSTATSFPTPQRVETGAPLPEGHKTIIVPEEAFYVIGDNRDNSFDSRYWGALPADHVLGTAILIYWSRSNRGIRWDRMFSFVR